MSTPGNTSNTAIKPRALPGFEKISRFWDPGIQHFNAKIKPGELYVTREAEAVSTVLGSCIAACIRDSQLGLGGMNHFMLPNKGCFHQENSKHKISGEAARYGNWAMEILINEILKLGGTRRNLEIKIFGGANIMKGNTNVAEENIQFVRDFIHNDNLKLNAEDVGDVFPRKVIYFPTTGKVRVMKVTGSSAKEITSQEQSYSAEINKDDTSGDIELF